MLIYCRVPPSQGLGNFFSIVNTDNVDTRKNLNIRHGPHLSGALRSGDVLAAGGIEAVIGTGAVRGSGAVGSYNVSCGSYRNCGSNGGLGRYRPTYGLYNRMYCDVPGSPCLSKNKANQVCNSFFLVNSAGWRLPRRSGPPVDGPKDLWSRVLSPPGRFVGDPAPLARDSIF